MSSADKWKVDFKLGPMRVSKLFRWVKAWFLTLGWSVHLVDVGLLEHHGSGIDKGDLPMKENLLKWPSFDWWIGWFRCGPFSSDPIERAFPCYFQKGRPTALGTLELALLAKVPLELEVAGWIGFIWSSAGCRLFCAGQLAHHLCIGIMGFICPSDAIGHSRN